MTALRVSMRTGAPGSGSRPYRHLSLFPDGDSQTLCLLLFGSSNTYVAIFRVVKTHEVSFQLEMSLSHRPITLFGNDQFRFDTR